MSRPLELCESRNNTLTNGFVEHFFSNYASFRLIFVLKAKRSSRWRDIFSIKCPPCVLTVLARHGAAHPRRVRYTARDRHEVLGAGAVTVRL